MAATTGTGKVNTRSITSEKRRMKRSSPGRSSAVSSGKSSPAENAVPSPVSTRALAPEAVTASSWAESRSRNAEPIALALPARIGKTATWPEVWISIPPLHREPAVHVHRAAVQVLALDAEPDRQPDVPRLPHR